MKGHFRVLTNPSTLVQERRERWLFQEGVVERRYLVTINLLRGNTNGRGFTTYLPIVTVR